MIKFRVLIISLVFVLLSSCAPTTEAVSTTDKGSAIQADLVATGDSVLVYSFWDKDRGGHRCYFTESDKVSLPGGIWCTP